MAKKKIIAKDVEISIQSVPQRKRTASTGSSKMTLEEKLGAFLIFVLFLAAIGYFIFNLF